MADRRVPSRNGTHHICCNDTGSAQYLPGTDSDDHTAAYCIRTCGGQYSDHPDPESDSDGDKEKEIGKERADQRSAKEELNETGTETQKTADHILSDRIYSIDSSELVCISDVYGIKREGSGLRDVPHHD